MKHLTAILILLILPLSIKAQVKFNSNIELGYEDRYLSIYQIDSPTAIAYLHNTLFTDLELGIQYKKLSLCSSIKTYIEPITIIEYQPVQSEYKIKLSYSLNRVHFKYEHVCSHSLDTPLFHEGYDRISVKFFLVK